MPAPQCRTTRDAGETDFCLSYEEGVDGFFFCNPEKIPQRLFWVLKASGKSKQKWTLPTLFVALPELFSRLSPPAPHGAEGRLAAAASACPSCGLARRGRGRGASQEGKSSPPGAPNPPLQNLCCRQVPWERRNGRGTRDTRSVRGGSVSYCTLH